MISGNIVSSAALILFGTNSHFGAQIGQILNLMAITLGVIVVASFVLTKVIKFFIK